MAEQSGQLDQISEAIGEIRGTVGGIERYIHDKRHDDANIAQKIEALGIRITRDIAAVEGRIEGRSRRWTIGSQRWSVSNFARTGQRTSSAGSCRAPSSAGSRLQS
jgi:hypothetical protein